LQELARLTLKGQQMLQEALHQRDISAQAQRFQRDKDQLAEFAASIVGKVAGTPEAPRSAPHEGVTEKTASRSITEVVEAYAQSQVAEQNWTAKTEAETRAIFDLWLRIVQDQPLAGYGFDQHREFKNTLLRLPPNMNKSPRYRGLSIDEVIALGDAPASPNTINKSLIRVSAFFKWASAHGYSTFAPAAMNIKNPRRANEERKAFSDDDLQKLFSSRAYRFGLHKQSYMHWTPLIALYSGARLNEIAQFHLDDFQEREGISVFSINDHGAGKRVKTAAGKRLIPIHSELIRLGLLRHVEKLRKSGQTRLFPELKARRDGYGQTVSKWFARYREQCGITEEGKVFHSFRHTVIDQLKQAGIAKEKIAALVGHEDESITFGRYGKDFQPAVMLGVVETLKFNCLEADCDEHATKGTCKRDDGNAAHGSMS
jgi:integrase